MVLEIDEIAEDIAAVYRQQPELEGVTFLGGEPFSQAAALSLLGERVKAIGLSVVTFTGYEYEKIIASGNTGWHRLLEVTDLLIDGPYLQHRHDLSRPWIGSANQQYRFLSEVYKPLQDKIAAIPNKLEIRLYPDGTLRVNGMAQALNIDMLHQLGYVRKEESG